MKKRVIDFKPLIWLVLVLLLIAFFYFFNLSRITGNVILDYSELIIADHNAITEFDTIPSYWIEKVKSQNLIIQMPGESHGNQLYGVVGDSNCPGGLELLESSSGGIYNVEIECNYNSLNEGNALRILKGQYKSGSWQGGTTSDSYCRTGEQDYWSDSSARTMTLGSATQANNQGDPLDASMYMWCYDVVRPDYCYDESSNRITYNDATNNAYLNAISTFNANPSSGGTKYVYTTSVTDHDWAYNPPGYTTEHGYRVTFYNALIRQAAEDNGGYLFDLADIENWNNANTQEYNNYSYNSLTLEIRNPEYDSPETCGHSNELLHVRKAKALWWMAARIVGWDGTVECIDEEHCGEVNVSNCELTSASWSETEIEEGMQVSLTVNGNNCDGENVNLELYEVDDFLVFTDYDLISSTNFPTSATFSGNQINLNWITEWVEDNSGSDIDPEYVFRVILGEEFIDVANYLKVVREVVEGDPQINSISNSGDLSDGNTYTIDGNYFGTKSPVKPLNWDTFDQNNIGDNLAGSTPVIGPDWGTLFASPVFVNEKVHSGDISALVDFNNGIKRFEHDLDPYESQVFMSWWRYHESDPELVLNDVGCDGISYGEPGYDADDCHNYKMLYLMGNSGEHHDQPQIMIGAIMTTRQNWQHAIQNVPATNYGWDTSYHYTETINQWQRWDTYAQTETGDFTQDNGILEAWLSGEKVLDRQNNDYGPTPHLWKDVGIGALFRPSGPYTKFQSFFDDIYIDNTRARIEICDVSSWSERETYGAHCELQIPLSDWDDGTGQTISFMANQGSFVSGQDYYLFIIDENGVASNAFSITFDGVAPFCGDENCNGDETCSSCLSDCGACPTCGDNQINQAFEVCDGNNLNEETCSSQGFNSGTLTCEGECLSFNFSSCLNLDCVIDSDCDDSNICTNNICNAGACEITNNTNSCNDGNACTTNEVCSLGSCSGDLTTSCINDDGCCPVSCTNLNDNDCGLITTDDADLYLPLDSNYNDYSDNSLSVSSSSYPVQGSGQINNAYSFNGVDNYLDYGDELNDLTLPLTLAAWIKVDDLTSNNPIIHTEDDPNDYSGAWLQIMEDGNIRAGYGGDLSSTSPSKMQLIISSTGIINVGQWHHLTAVINGDQDIGIYVDGISQSGFYDGTYAGTYTSTPDSLIIGRRMVYSDSFFSGDLDEVRIYDKALTQSEIQEIMESSPSSCIDSDGDGFNLSSEECGVADCNDENNQVYPGSIELCDGLDNDCNSLTSDGVSESWFGEVTSCGIGECLRSGILTCKNGNQVDSCLPGVPGSIELCDGLDNDCNSLTFDGSGESWFGEATSCGIGECSNVGILTCKNGNQADSCLPGVPGAIELCDGLDNDCNSLTFDGVGESWINTNSTCGIGECSNVGTFICEDGAKKNNCLIFEGTLEICNNSLDDDCDGYFDLNDTDCVDDPDDNLPGDGYTPSGTTGNNPTQIPSNNNFPEENDLSDLSVQSNFSFVNGSVYSAEIEHSGSVFNLNLEDLNESNYFLREGIINYDSFNLSSSAGFVKGKVYFKIPFSWLNANNLNSTDIVLYSLISNVEYKTTEISRDDNFVYFVSEVDSLGEVAIIGKSSIEEKDFNYVIWIIIAVLIIAIIFVLLWVLREKNKFKF